MGKTLAPIVVAAIIAASVLLATGMVTDTAVEIKNKGYVTVKGFATQQIRSDLGTFEARIIVEDEDLKKCYEKLDRDKKTVRAFLADGYAISENEIVLRPAWVHEIYKINEQGHQTSDVARYALQQSFRIQSDDVEKIARIASGIVEVLKEGVRVSVSEPEYVYTKLEDLKVEMIGRATDNARQRAAVVADKGNFELGSIADVRTGVFQITPLNSTSVSDYGISDTSSIDKEIKSVVEIRYFVE
jgi:hypothetical protein